MKTMQVFRYFVVLFIGILLFQSRLAWSANPQVLIETSEGNITLELYQEQSPITVANFISYVKADFYDGSIFHRVIPRFMIQGGGFTPDMVRKETLAPIQNESANGLSNLRGTIAMARTNDPNSATAQFYINQNDNTFLDGSPNKPGYAVFGKVIKGLEIVDKIAKTPTKSVNFMNNVPANTIIIKDVTILNASSKTDSTKDM